MNDQTVPPANTAKVGDGLPAHAQGHEQAICTLYEGNYHLGVAVLINSVVRNGFRGLFWVGYRGELPPWTGGLRRRDDGLFEVGEALLGFEKADDGLHLTHFKPIFMHRLLRRGIAKRYLWYFDPDITVRCEWSFFERWVKQGVCLCQEITMGLMPANHPIRCQWLELARAAGWGEATRQLERYYNAGFVGLAAKDAGFLDRWEAAEALAAAAGSDMRKFQNGTRAHPFHSADQDAMNLAAMYCQEALSTLGPEGMGWMDGGFTMYHTVGSKKPWRKNFLRSALAGDPPWRGDKHFLACADGPIWPYSKARLRALRWSARLAALMGRFYRRG